MRNGELADGLEDGPEVVALEEEAVAVVEAHGRNS
jgi:hypothetical protein